VFGEVAALYDQHRPAYPPALYDDLMVAAPKARRVLEAGAGTGKATAALAERGLEVVAVEPDSAMADVARRVCARMPVTVVESSFEDWPGADAEFDLVVSAQAWHWIDPLAGLAVAARALRPGGVLALWWNGAADDGRAIRRAIEEAYRRWAPDLAEHSVMNRWGVRTIAPDTLRAAGFRATERHVYDWTATYDTAEYTQLLRTHSDHRVLPPADLERLLSAVAAAIDRTAGGRLDYRYRTQLLLARLGERVELGCTAAT
jgi:SAM-dependent methyltransferase